MLGRRLVAVFFALGGLLVISSRQLPQNGTQPFARSASMFRMRTWFTNIAASGRLYWEYGRRASLVQLRRRLRR